MERFRCMHGDTVTLYLEQCPAKSPLWYYQILQNKEKKSNARIEMYG